MKKTLTKEEQERLNKARERFHDCAKGLVGDGFQFPEIYGASAELTILLLIKAFPDPVQRGEFICLLVELAMADVKPVKNGEKKS